MLDRPYVTRGAPHVDGAMQEGLRREEMRRAVMVGVVCAAVVLSSYLLSDLAEPRAPLAPLPTSWRRTLARTPPCPCDCREHIEPAPRPMTWGPEEDSDAGSFNSSLVQSLALMPRRPLVGEEQPHILVAVLSADTRSPLRRTLLCVTT